MDRLHLVQTRGLSIFSQLQLEEALVRTDDHLWCLVNEGSPPAIVLGISGQLDEVDHERAASQHIPLIRRFSGGGTVVVDEGTLFVTFLGPKSSLRIPCFPEPIMRWTGSFYAQALKLPQFAVRENDYVIDQRKCGGNAQYFRKDHWLHHTSFLWTYQQDRMACLNMPRRTPSYRCGREHHDFLTPLSDHIVSLEFFLSALRDTLALHFHITHVPLAQLNAVLRRPHRRVTQLLNTASS